MDYSAYKMSYSKRKKEPDELDQRSPRQVRRMEASPATSIDEYALSPAYEQPHSVGSSSSGASYCYRGPPSNLSAASHESYHSNLSSGSQESLHGSPYNATRYDSFENLAASPRKKTVLDYSRAYPSASGEWEGNEYQLFSARKTCEAVPVRQDEALYGHSSRFDFSPSYKAGSLSKVTREERHSHEEFNSEHVDHMKKLPTDAELSRHRYSPISSFGIVTESRSIIREHHNSGRQSPKSMEANGCIDVVTNPDSDSRAYVRSPSPDVHVDVTDTTYRDPVGSIASNSTTTTASPAQIIIDEPSSSSSKSLGSMQETSPAPIRIDEDPKEQPTIEKPVAPKACLVCGDKVIVEHFNMPACDSCYGFFKRAIKNNRTYTCLNLRNCTLNKRTRNHCQYCRLEKCVKVGMKSDEAMRHVERDKQRKLLKKAYAAQSVAKPPPLVDISMLIAAEDFVDPKIEKFADVSMDPIRHICLAADKQLASLTEWAKRLPHFKELSLMDQVRLLQWNWSELLIGGFCYRSSAVTDGILLATGLHLSRENLQKAGVTALVNALFTEVINKMRKLKIDLSEWGCLRAIMLFAPDTKGLQDQAKVQSIRNVYTATMRDYCTKTFPDQPDRIGKLLLRLAPLKNVCLQVLEHLFFFKLIGDLPIDTFLLEMLDKDDH